MKPKSKVFNHFTENTVNNKSTFMCNFCKSVYHHKNATRFACHLLKCEASPNGVKDEFRQYNRNQQPSTICSAVVHTNGQQYAVLQDSSSQETATPNYMDRDKQMEIHEALARAMVATRTPLSHFEHPLWIEAFRKINPLYTLPSRQLLAKLIKKYSEE